MVGLWHVRCFIGLGAIFASLSELWFYPVSGLAGLTELVVFYAIAAHAAVLIVHVFGGGGALGTYLVAVFLGFAIEGIPVFELYSALPFTLVWTSMAWHGLVSGFLGVWAYRACAARGFWWFLAGNITLGAALGVWGAFFWSQEPEGLRFDAQLPWAFGLFVLGQIILPKGTPPERFLRPVLWAMLALIAFGFSNGALVAAFPASLVLPVALAITTYAAFGAQSPNPLWPDIPVRLIWVMVFLPVVAWVFYFATVTRSWVAEINAYAILALGPISVGLLLWCLFKAVKSNAFTKGRRPDAF